MPDAIQWRQPRDHHVGVTNGLDLVHVIVLQYGVKHGVKVIQKVHHLKYSKKW